LAEVVKSSVKSTLPGVAIGDKSELLLHAVRRVIRAAPPNPAFLRIRNVSLLIWLVNGLI
jgi:hypothetical protein